MTTLTISLPESFKMFIRAQIKAKGFGNVSEYFRTLLRQAKEQEADERLEAFLVGSLNAGEDIPLTRDFWKDLKDEAARLVKKHNKVS